MVKVLLSWVFFLVYLPSHFLSTTPCQSNNGHEFSMARIFKIWWPQLLNDPVCLPVQRHNGLNLPILHGFRHFYFSVNGHSCRFCLLLRTWTMLRPTSYLKIYIGSTFSPFCHTASTRCQFWPALLGSAFSLLGAITGTSAGWVSSTQCPRYGGKNPAALGSGMGS
jgi:hypothetical protein